MHIMIVTACMSGGGAERVISRLLADFTKRGVRCTLVLMHKKEIEYRIPEQTKVIEIGVLSGSSAADKLKKYARVRAIAKEEKPDLILSMPEEIGIYVALAMMGSSVPVVVSERNNPWVMPYKKITRFLRRVAYPHTKGLIFQTEMAASFFPKSQRKKGIVLPNPLDTENIPLPHEGERDKRVVAAGRLETQKNFPLLIHAFAQFCRTHPDYELVIYGEGSERPCLEDLSVQEIEGESWSLPGRSSCLAEEMKSASMFVLSSDYEGMPNALIEAMALGIPSISTDCPSGGSAELIEDGVNGLLTPVGDKEALCLAMCRIAEDGELARTLSENGVKIKERLCCERVCALWLDYLTSVADKSSKKHKKNKKTKEDKE